MPAPPDRAEELSKSYGAVAALARLDLEDRPGDVLGYLGPNGSGKTTTIRLLLGQIQPTSGRVEIFGPDRQDQVVEAHRHLADLPGETDLWPELTSPSMPGV
jgi:ABC-2 type transport system ATP-binding protein